MCSQQHTAAGGGGVRVLLQQGQQQAFAGAPRAVQGELALLFVKMHDALVQQQGSTAAAAAAAATTTWSQHYQPLLADMGVILEPSTPPPVAGLVLVGVLQYLARLSCWATVVWLLREAHHAGLLGHARAAAESASLSSGGLVLLLVDAAAAARKRKALELHVHTPAAHAGKRTCAGAPKSRSSSHAAALCQQPPAAHCTSSVDVGIVAAPDPGLSLVLQLLFALLLAAVASRLAVIA